jgi:two-component sensor histidine kinase
MAQIHEQLTHNENLAQVNMASYIDELVSSLRIAYGTEKVAIQIDVSDVTLPFDSLSPCGLLINELVSNAMKHAFPSDAPPDQNKIQIVLRQLPTDNQMLELVVTDNGVGLPDDFDPTNTASLGLTLVDLLVRQLNASLEVESGPGTTFRIVFAP